MQSSQRILPPNPRERVNILSILTFAWTIPVFKKGYSKILGINDIFRTLNCDRSMVLGDRLEKWVIPFVLWMFDVFILLIISKFIESVNWRRVHYILIFFAQKLGKRIGQNKTSIVVDCFHCNILEGVQFVEFNMHLQWSGRSIGATASFEPIAALFSVIVCFVVSFNSNVFISSVSAILTNEYVDMHVDMQDRFNNYISWCVAVRIWHSSL